MTSGLDAALPCICVFGHQSPADDWLAQLQARQPGARIVLAGHPPRGAGLEHLDVVAGEDPLALLDALTARFPGHDLLLLSANSVLLSLIHI